MSPCACGPLDVEVGTDVQSTHFNFPVRAETLSARDPLNKSREPGVPNRSQQGVISAARHRSAAPESKTTPGDLGRVPTGGVCISRQNMSPPVASVAAPFSASDENRSFLPGEAGPNRAATAVAATGLARRRSLVEPRAARTLARLSQCWPLVIGRLQTASRTQTTPRAHGKQTMATGIC